MLELFSQKLKANFTPEQQDYYLQLENELKELLGGQTQEEVLASGDPEIIQQILKIKQEMLNFVLTKKTREMVRQEEAMNQRLLKQNEEQLEYEQQIAILDNIEIKHNAGQQLTESELKFLYRLDGLGLPFDVNDKEQKRLDSIIFNRNFNQEVANLLGCREDQVCLLQNEGFDNGDMVYHLGDIDLPDVTQVDDLVLPKIINGGVFLRDLIFPEGLQLPQTVVGHLDLFLLASVDDLSFPDFVAGDVNLRSLLKAKDLRLPKVIGMDVNLNDLEEVDKLIFPDQVPGNVNLSKLKNFKNLILPRSIGGNLDLRSLSSPDGLVLPRFIGGSLDLSGLQTLEGLIIPLGIKKVDLSHFSDEEMEKIREKFPHVEFANYQNSFSSSII